MSDTPISKESKRAKRCAWIMWSLSFAVTVVPVIVYVFIGFFEGSVGQKFTLGITITVALILVMVNIIFKFHLRSALWVLVLGIYFCLKDILPLLLIIAIGTVLDEFIFAPQYRKYRSRYMTNREIDKRLS